MGIEHCLQVVQAEAATLQGLNPGTFSDDELALYMALWGQEDTLEERIKALSGHAGQLKKLKGGWYELKAQHS